MPFTLLTPGTGRGANVGGLLVSGALATGLLSALACNQSATHESKPSPKRVAKPVLKVCERPDSFDDATAHVDAFVNVRQLVIRRAPFTPEVVDIDSSHWGLEKRKFTLCWPGFVTRGDVPRVRMWVEHEVVEMSRKRKTRWGGPLDRVPDPEHETLRVSLSPVLDALGSDSDHFEIDLAGWSQPLVYGFEAGGKGQ